MVRFWERHENWSRQLSTGIPCSNTNCGKVVPEYYTDWNHDEARCPDCRTVTCTRRRAEWHIGPCIIQDPATRQTIRLAEREGWRMCFRCGHIIEWTGGCPQMTRILPVFLPY
ncbi:hypothetical protein B0T25DRAFT_542676 [Lasiosphaeria hispida]|uniref:IBR domain-containing protein n=1 Tax=Lasiosphaeria hispida TaxID=260671 RepID=A0AAJ0HHU7_9PEZI|nr:hypothetical protein B0T25DRAFT_542676 [Lasiosphaeria hispida]